MKRLYPAIVLTLIYLTLPTQTFSQIVNIPDPAFKAQLVGNAAINTNVDPEIQVSEATAYTGGIFVGTQGISDLTGIEAFTGLTALDVSQNSLASIDLSYNIALTSLYCNFNSLTCLDLSNNSALVVLDCSDNSLTALNLKNGNNTILTNYNSIGNPSLTCIQVSNVAYANSTWISHDPSSNFNLVCGPQPVANFISNAPVCCGTPVTFTETATFETNWHWDFGDGGTSTAQNPTHTYGSVGDYIVSLIAKNCNGADTIGYTIVQGTDLHGQVTYSGGNVTNGVAILYPHVPFFTSFDTLQIQSLDAAGMYHFTNVQQGDYLVQIFPDTIAYPLLVETYYGDEWSWEAASVFTHACSVDDFADIVMVEITPVTPGPGLIQGYVQTGPGFGRAEGDPVHGVVVKRGITSSTQILETTTTDANGSYFFKDLPFGNYTIYVDMPGLEKDSVYDVVVDATTNQFTGLNYGVDSVKVYILPGIGIEDILSSDNSEMNVFPNPVKEIATIQYALNVNAKVELAVYNILGVKVQTLVNAHLQSGEYECNFNPKSKSLEPGVYFVSLTVAGRTKTMSIVVME